MSQAEIITTEALEELEREQFLRELLDGAPINDDLDDPINSDVAADAYLARIRDFEEAIARNTEVSQRRIEMIQAWLSDANGSLERQRGWLAQALEAVAQGYDFGKKKSRALPHGTFGYRSKAETLAIVDQAAALAFAKEQGLDVTVKESVGVTPLKEYFAKSGGVLPDGVEFVPASETFYIKVS